LIASSTAKNASQRQPGRKRGFWGAGVGGVGGGVLVEETLPDRHGAAPSWIRYLLRSVRRLSKIDGTKQGVNRDAIFLGPGLE
jgi:hypothetical protein